MSRLEHVVAVGHGLKASRDAEADTGSKKLGSEDLARALRERERSRPQGLENMPTPPPPPPLEG